MQLQEINGLLKKYRNIYPYRIFFCYVTTYLLYVPLLSKYKTKLNSRWVSLQAFSLPGSMYLSILGGALWGAPRAVPLACCCVATGATLCYLISAALGPALLILPRIKAKLDTWATKIRENRENIMSFLIVLRIAPLPPHWVVNIICPHVGIGIVPFWVSTALGIFGVTVIHTTIGGGLDDMTSADDFHLISWRNFFGLAAIVIGVLIPIGLRHWFQSSDGSLAEHYNAVEPVVFPYEDDPAPQSADCILAIEEPVAKSPFGKFQFRHAVFGADDTTSYDDDDDITLEVGLAIVKLKHDQEAATKSGSLL